MGFEGAKIMPKKVMDELPKKNKRLTRDELDLLRESKTKAGVLLSRYNEMEDNYEDSTVDTGDMKSLHQELMSMDYDQLLEYMESLSILFMSDDEPKFVFRDDLDETGMREYIMNYFFPDDNSWKSF